MIHKTNDSLVTIQAEATALNKTGVVFWSHDRGTAKLRFKLTKDGQAQSLPEGTTVPIRLIFKSSTAEGGYGKHDYLATVEDRLNGIVSIVLEDNILGYVGTVEGSIYIDFPNDQSLDTAGRFSFAIKRSPIDDATPELEDYYFNGFSKFLDQFAEAENRIKETQKQLENVGDSITELETIIAEGEDHFVTKESVEVGPVIYKELVVTDEDWDTLTTPGIFYCKEASGNNCPPIRYGILTVTKILNSIVLQEFRYQDNFFTRTFGGNPGNWTAWTKIATVNGVMNLTDPQTVDGVKNFLETPMVNEVEVLVNDLLPFEAWYGRGDEIKGPKDKARLRVGPEITNLGTQLNRKMKDSPIEWNAGRYLATVKRDCKLLVDASIVLEFGSTAGAYTYIDFWKDEAQTQVVSEGSGMGIKTEYGYWYRNTVPFSRYVELKIGEVFSFGTAMEDGKTLNKAVVQNLHIMEVV